MPTPRPLAPADATGLAVPIALPAPLARVRRRWDRAALAGAGAHVTLLYPFLPRDRLVPSVRSELATLAAGTAPWVVRFDRVRRWEEGLVWIEPVDALPFRGLTEAVVSRWPDHPPYGGLFDEVIVHLTIAESDAAPLELVEAVARRAVPFEARAERMEVWRQEGGRWRPHWRLPFGDVRLRR